MSSGPRVDLNKLVRRIVVDAGLLRWFATRGGRRIAAVAAIDAAATGAHEGEREILAFLERYIAPSNGGGRAND
jgi:hypothetical protein